MRFTLPVAVAIFTVAFAAPAPLDNGIQTILDSPAAPLTDSPINLAQRISSVISKFQRSVKLQTAGATKSLKKKSYYVDFAAQLSRQRVARNQVSARPGPSAHASAGAAGPSARPVPSARASAGVAGPSARPGPSAHASIGAVAGPSARLANAGPSPSPNPSQLAKRELVLAEALKRSTQAAPWESLDDSVLCPAGESACPIFPRNSSYECVDLSFSLESCGGCASVGEGQDCTAIKGALGVTCQMGECMVFSCQSNFKLVADSEDVNSCQPAR